jgi:putative transposase
MIFQRLIAMVAGWLQRHQQQVITYLQAENRVLKAQLGGRRLRLTEPLSRGIGPPARPHTPAGGGHDRHPRHAPALVPPPDRSDVRRKPPPSSPWSRPRVAEEIEQLVVRMAEENATWGYRRIQGALANLGYSTDTITVRNIVRRHHLDPAPRRRQAGLSWEQFLKLH